MPIVEMQTARAKDLRREVELPAPVFDNRPAKKIARPGVHFTGHLLGNLMEQGIADNGQLQVPLVVQGHRVHLPHGVFAIEHPAIGPGKQGVSHVTD